MLVTFVTLPYSNTNWISLNDTRTPYEMLNWGVFLTGD